MPKTIAVLRGSPRADSLTQKLARGIELAVGDRLTFNDIAIHDLPLYNPDLEKDAAHPDWDAFRAAVKACDGLLFVSPEWNRSVPGGLKNAIDIGSRPYGQGVFQKKPTAVVTQSSGGTGGLGRGGVGAFGFCAAFKAFAFFAAALALGGTTIPR